MVSLRTAAFLLGAVGLALFLGGIIWAVVGPTDPSCAEFPASPECRDGYQGLVRVTMWLIGAGLLLEAGAITMLFMHLLKRVPAPPATTGVRPPGLRTAVPPPQREGGAPAPPAPPRNRFLEPPVPPRNGAGKGP